MGKKTKPADNKKRAREAKLIEELQVKHGYTLMEASGKMERVQMVFDKQTKKIGLAIVVRLALPYDSALGEAFAKMREEAKKKGAKKP